MAVRRIATAAGASPVHAALASAALLVALLSNPARAVQAAPAGAPSFGESPSLRETLPERWRWRSFRGTGDEQRLRCVRPDGEGGLLLADSGNLWRFDGLTWSLLASWSKVPSELILDIVPTAEGWLLVAPRRMLRVRRAAPHGQTLEELCTGHLQGRLAVAPDGRLAFSDLSTIYLIEAEGRVPWLEQPEHSGQVSSLAFDADGRLWCLTSVGLYRHGPQGWESMPVQGEVREVGGMAIALRSGSRLIFLPRIFARRQAGLVWDGQQLSPLPDSGMEGEFVDAAEGPGGQIIAAVRHNGLSVLDEHGWYLPELPPEFDDSPASVAWDPVGRLALVTPLGGLRVFDHASARWQRFDPRPHGVSPIVNVLAPARAGGLWLGTHEGLIRFADGRFLDGELKAANLDLELFGITALVEDSQGALWVGSGRFLDGVLRRKDGVWTQHHPGGMPGRSVHALRQAPDGRLWVALLSRGDEFDFSQGGVAFWDGQQLVEPAGSRRVDGSPVSRTYDVAFTPEGDVLGAFIDGPARLGPDGWESLGQPAFEAGAKTFTLHAARDGTLWAGHDLWIPGVARRPLDTTDPTWEVLEAPRWRGVGAARFAEAPDGALWMASESGLFRYAGQGCRRIRTDEVVREAAFWDLRFDEAGDLWLASLGGGLLRLRPDEDRNAPRSRDLRARLDLETEPGVLAVSWSLRDPWDSSPPEELSWRMRVDSGPWSSWSASALPPSACWPS